MNRTGYSTSFVPQAPNVLASNSSGNSNPAVTGLLEKSDVKVGDTWAIPVSTNGSMSSSNGNVTLKFVDIQDITVPAGTYKVFRVDSSSNDTVLNLNLAQPNFNATPTISIDIAMSGQTYVEYDTGRQIESDMHIQSTIQSEISTPTSDLNSTTQTASPLGRRRHISPDATHRRHNSQCKRNVTAFDSSRDNFASSHADCNVASGTNRPSHRSFS